MSPKNLVQLSKENTTLSFPLPRQREELPEGAESRATNHLICGLNQSWIVLTMKKATRLDVLFEDFRHRIFSKAGMIGVSIESYVTSAGESRLLRWVMLTVRLTVAGMKATLGKSVDQAIIAENVRFHHLLRLDSLEVLLTRYILSHDGQTQEDANFSQPNFGGF
jgi:hypothetical protein